MNKNAQPLKFFLIAGEHSGDALGGKLMEGLKAECEGHSIDFFGLGGQAMEHEGLTSLFPMEEVAVMGPTAILARLPNLIKRVYQCVDRVLDVNPNALIIIDSPEFTHPIAKRVRKKAPHIPIINYVSPTIWAWRPGRAKKMKPYVDEVLALLPFEPDYHQKLGGPSCHYVGHPLIEKKTWVEALDLDAFEDQYALQATKKSFVVLPGSRPNEVKHLLAPFGDVIGQLQESLGPLNLLLPTVGSMRTAIEEGVKQWPSKPIIVTSDEDKYAAFKYADAALAASGTVTLELAITGTPMVVAYRYDRYLKILGPLVQTEMIALANHILGQKAFPELIQEDCTPENIVQKLLPLFDHSSQAYQDQKQHLNLIDERMFAVGKSPSRIAAKQCLETMQIRQSKFS